MREPPWQQLRTVLTQTALSFNRRQHCRFCNIAWVRDRIDHLVTCDVNPPWLSELPSFNFVSCRSFGAKHAMRCYIVGAAVVYGFELFQ